MKYAQQIVTAVLIVAALGLLAFLLAGSRSLGSFDIMRESDTYSIALSLPKTKNESLNASLADYGTAITNEFAEMYAPSMFTPEEYEMLGFGEGRKYALQVTGTRWSFDGITGVLLERYTYTGGAHGATDYIHFAEDAAGTPVALSALFIPESAYLTRISDYVRPVLKEQLTNDAAYVEDMFVTGTSPDEGNYMVFMLGKNGITFVFQQYQVGPYSIGAPRVEVPYTVLRDILNPSYF